jgi:hypothetical protein
VPSGTTGGQKRHHHHEGGRPAGVAAGPEFHFRLRSITLAIATSSAAADSPVDTQSSRVESKKLRTSIRRTAPAAIISRNASA